MAKTTKKNTAEGFAVIKTGGKQYRVSAGEKIRIEKLSDDSKVGDKVTFDEVLLVDNGSTTTLGTPRVAGAKVSGVISDIGRSKKVVVMRYKQKSRNAIKNGHRQPYFDITIDSVTA